MSQLHLGTNNNNASPSLFNMPPFKLSECQLSRPSLVYVLNFALILSYVSMFTLGGVIK